MKIALVQSNPIVGDLNHSFTLLKNHANKAVNDNVSLVIFSECFLTGYPPLDLLTYPSFLDQIDVTIDKIKDYSKTIPETALCFGTPIRNFNHTSLLNAVYVIHNGKIIFNYFKCNLPNYDIFDEKRYFKSSKIDPYFEFNSYRFGITICEDAWPGYKQDLISDLKQSNIDCLINLSASPYEIGKQELRYNLFANHAKTLQAPVIVVNQVGANDHLIFDGNSFAVSKTGTTLCQCSSFSDDYQILDLTHNLNTKTLYIPQSRIQSIHDALILGIRDYVKKTGFNDVVIGLSGGIDSAVTCALAVKALGSKHVRGYALPSEFSSQGSLDDAKALADALEISYAVMPINNSYQAINETLAPQFSNFSPDLTEENIQARIRGVLLMAIANKFNALVLTTGNKSELATGYCTLYGDMCGALGVLADVYKTTVYELANHLNKDKLIIPLNTIEKEPSAELRQDQKDSDSLPNYDVLDLIIKSYIEKSMSLQQIESKGYGEKDIVSMVINRINHNEYKRKQAPIPLRISTHCFVTGRRFPVGSSYNL
jgi:NAD+ synthase (glutamine-hydrolysing)